MSDRLTKYGQFVATAGENIAYGTTGGKDIVLQLIIDDGVASRGHRTNIFKTTFKNLGSWSSGHVTYKSETVIDYAGGMTSNNKFAVLPSIDCTAPVTTTSASTSGTTAAATGSTTTTSTGSTTTPATGTIAAPTTA